MGLTREGKRDLPGEFALFTDQILHFGPQWYRNFKKVTSRLAMATPSKINMDHNHGGLEDHVPF